MTTRNYDPEEKAEEIEKCDRCHLVYCICDEVIDSIDWNRILLDVMERTCPYCNGTNISPYSWDGGSCPHCFDGVVDY